MKAVQATIALGCNPGYFHNNVYKCSNFYNDFQKITEEYAEQTGKYISFVVIPATVMYKKEWGCPESGENVFYLQAVMNPVFDKDIEEWKQRVIDIINHLKEEFQQTTVTITFTEADVVYLK